MWILATFIIALFGTWLFTLAWFLTTMEPVAVENRRSASESE